MSTLSDLHAGHPHGFVDDLGRDVLALGAGAAIASVLGVTTLWALDSSTVLTGWNATGAAWSLVPALALLLAHLVVARAWLNVPTPWIDGRAAVLSALMLAPAVCLLSADFLAGAVGLLGGPTHPNATAEDLGAGQGALRVSVAVLVAVLAWLTARRLHTARH